MILNSSLKNQFKIFKNPIFSIDVSLLDCKKGISVHCTEVEFTSFSSGGQQGVYWKLFDMTPYNE